MVRGDPVDPNDVPPLLLANVTKQDVERLRSVTGDPSSAAVAQPEQPLQPQPATLHLQGTGQSVTVWCKPGTNLNGAR